MQDVQKKQYTSVEAFQQIWLKPTLTMNKSNAC